jgi:hypothetical protein
MSWNTIPEGDPQKDARWNGVPEPFPEIGIAILPLSFVTNLHNAHHNFNE